MNEQKRLLTSSKVNVAGLIAAAAGIMTQYLSDAEGFPTIPPGPIILVAVAGLVAFGSWRWTRVVGLAAPLIVLISGVVANVVRNGGPLTNPSEIGAFIGGIIQFVGLIVAVAAGVATVRQTWPV